MTLNLSEATPNMDRAIKMGDQLAEQRSKFYPDHVRGVTWLREAAEDYIRKYDGSFEYMLKLAAALDRYGKLGFDNQVSGALNCMMVEVRREREEAMKLAAEAQTSILNEPIDFAEVDDESDYKGGYMRDEHDYKVIGKRADRPSVGDMIAPEPGYYTVAFEDGTHSTIRVRRTGKSGYTRFAYLRGPDNEHDYTNFAYMGDNGKLRHIAGSEKPTRTWEAVLILIGANKAKLTEYGKAYAMHSGNCYRCGRLLTDPESIAASLGPICRGAM